MMRAFKRYLVSAVCVVSTTLCALGAQAQEAPATRGTAKVRVRAFNPFDVSSRFSLNRFGFLSSRSPLEATAPASILPASPTTVAEPVLAAGTASLAGPEVSAESSVSTTSTGNLTLRPPVIEEDTPETTVIGIPLLAPPPYSPPLRSPYRPPPRPPF